MGVYIGQPVVISDMQGPAPEGFHVPLSSERGAIYNAGLSLGAWGSSHMDDFKNYLKLPFAGYRSRSSADVSGQGTYGYYWSSSHSSAGNAYCLSFYSGTLNRRHSLNRAYGYSVRCFKDVPTMPTSSWTKLYGTSIEAGGIFWSSTDGLISLSSDGNTWITIQDKNLGATTVWNDGDTLSEANCGKYYQRGNNYGFPRTGSVTTSSTRVDASNYGPGNYYSSDTFITYKGAWDTTDNGNLWGGVSQGSSEGITMSDLKNAYIGEYRVPGANTIAYYPLTSSTTVNDMSGNNKTLTNNGATFGVYQGVDSSYLNGNMYYYGISDLQAFTLNCWYCLRNMSEHYYLFFGMKMGTGVNTDNGFQLGETNGRPGGYGFGVQYMLNNNHNSVNVGTSSADYSTIGTWYNGVVTYDGTTIRVYQNGVLKNSRATAISGTKNTIFIGYNSTNSQVNLSNAIIENKAWTDAEILSYYNQTKANYGL